MLSSQQESLESCCFSPWPPMRTASPSLIIHSVWPQRADGFLPSEEKTTTKTDHDRVWPRRANGLLRKKQKLIICRVWPQHADGLLPSEEKQNYWLSHLLAEHQFKSPSNI